MSETTMIRLGWCLSGLFCTVSCWGLGRTKADGHGDCDRDDGVAGLARGAGAADRVLELVCTLLFLYPPTAALGAVLMMAILAARSPRNCGPALLWPAIAFSGLCAGPVDVAARCGCAIRGCARSCPGGARGRRAPRSRRSGPATGGVPVPAGRVPARADRRQAPRSPVQPAQQIGLGGIGRDDRRRGRRPRVSGRIRSSAAAGPCTMLTAIARFSLTTAEGAIRASTV